MGIEWEKTWHRATGGSEDGIEWEKTWHRATGGSEDGINRSRILPAAGKIV